MLAVTLWQCLTRSCNHVRLTLAPAAAEVPSDSRRQCRALLPRERQRPELPLPGVLIARDAVLASSDTASPWVGKPVTEIACPADSVESAGPCHALCPTLLPHSLRAAILKARLTLRSKGCRAVENPRRSGSTRKHFSGTAGGTVIIASALIRIPSWPLRPSRQSRGMRLHALRVCGASSRHDRVPVSRRDILGYARSIGDLLRSVPPEEGAAVAAQAGITGRTRFYYVTVAESWEQVKEAKSLNEALRIIRKGATRCTGGCRSTTSGALSDGITLPSNAADVLASIGLVLWKSISRRCCDKQAGFGSVEVWSARSALF
jgi:hypothetical protein